MKNFKITQRKRPPPDHVIWRSYGPIPALRVFKVLDKIFVFSRCFMGVLLKIIKAYLRTYDPQWKSLF